MIGLKQIVGVLASIVLMVSTAVVQPGDDSGAVALEELSSGGQRLVAQSEAATVALTEVPVFHITSSQGVLSPGTVLDGQVERLELLTSTKTGSLDAELGGQSLAAQPGSTISIEALTGTVTVGQTETGLVATVSGTAEELVVEPPTGQPISTLVTSGTGIPASEITIDGNPLAGNHRSQGSFRSLTADLVGPEPGQAPPQLVAGSQVVDIERNVSLHLEELVGVVVTVELDQEHVLLRIDGYANITLGGERIQEDVSLSVDSNHPTDLPANQPPTAAFDYHTDTDVPTIHEPVEFIDRSEDDLFVDDWSWSFGDGGTSSQRHPTHTFQDPGVYNVTLTVSDAQGASDTTHRLITVHNPRPEITILMNPADPIEGQEVRFEASVEDPDGGNVSDLHWSFSDGMTSTDRILDRTFIARGEIGLTVTAVDDEGERGWSNRTITVANAPPTPSFELQPASPVAGEQATLVSTSTDWGNGTITNATWQVTGIDDLLFGDTVDLAFPRDGQVPITLTVTDDLGETSSLTRQVEIQNPAPVVTISHTPTYPNPGETVTFVAQVEDDDLPESAHWSFPNGIERDGLAVNIAFSQGGQVPVTVAVTDADGATTEASKTITINHEPTVTLDRSTPEVLTNETITFTATNDDQDGNITDRTWTIDGRGLSNQEACFLTSDSTPSHQILDCVWAEAGPHRVRLTVTDDDGAQTSNESTVLVENRPPTVNPKLVSGPVSTGEVATFEANASDPDAPDRELNITWTHDGQIIGFGQVINEVFDEAGEDVTLDVQATDADGGQTTASVTFHVNAPPRIDSLSVTDATVEAGEEVSFSVEATDPEGDALSYTWDFGDGATATGNQVSHTYDTGGRSYEAQVTVSDSLGASTTRQRSIEVTAPELTVSLAVSDTEPLEGDTVTFTVDVPTGRSIESVTWTFGDGTTLTTGAGQDSATHVYEVPEHVTARATVNADSGSQDSATNALRIRGDQAFTVTLEPRLPDEQCLDLTHPSVTLQATNLHSSQRIGLSGSSLTFNTVGQCRATGQFPPGNWSIGDGLGILAEVGQGITVRSPGFSASGSFSAVPFDLQDASILVTDLTVTDRNGEPLLLNGSDDRTTRHDATEDVEVRGLVTWITGQPADRWLVDMETSYSGLALAATGQPYHDAEIQTDEDGLFEELVPKPVLQRSDLQPEVDGAFLPGDYTVAITASSPGTQADRDKTSFTVDPEGVFGTTGLS